MTVDPRAVLLYQELANRLGGITPGAGQPEDPWVVTGVRSGRTVRVEIDASRGTVGVACASRPLPIASFSIEDRRSIFASDGVPITHSLALCGPEEARALWLTLPEPVRDEIGALLAARGSRLTVARRETELVLGSPRPASELEASAVLAALDRLLQLASILEGHRGGSSPWRDPAIVARLAARARDAMVAAHAGSLIEDLPAVDPMRAAAALTGKVARLPPQPPTGWAREAINKAIVGGTEATTLLFAKTSEPALGRALRAVARYEEATGESLTDEPHEVIGRLTGRPSMFILSGSPRVGLEVETLGLFVPDRVFVDASVVIDGESPFTGE